MRAEPRVSIVIVSYNTRELTCACLRSIARETDLDTVDVIVWDNASTDGSVEAIKACAPFARVIKSSENIGFARANNRAAELASGELLLLLNPDTLVTNRAIERLVAFSACCPDARIWGGRTIFADGSLNPGSCWRRITFWSLLCRASGLTGVFKNSPVFNSEAYGGWKRDTHRPVDIVSGCFLLIERKLWNQLGGFSPRYFMYGDDADLCLRAQVLGATPLITPEATIVHYGGASETNSADKLVRLLKAKSSLIDDHFHPAGKLAAKLLLAAWPLSRAIACRTVAAIKPGQANRERADTWSTVWRRRREWFAGYERLKSAASLSAPATLPAAAKSTG
jgi:GT2 family glycosyltransferase